MHPDLSAPYDWANLFDAQNEGLRMEQEARHSFSVNARHNAAIRYAEQVLYPAAELALAALAVAITSPRAEDMVAAHRRLSSVGELARYEAEKLERRSA